MKINFVLLRQKFSQKMLDVLLYDCAFLLLLDSSYSLLFPNTLASNMLIAILAIVLSIHPYRTV